MLSIYASRTGQIGIGLLSKSWFEALVDDENAFEIMGGGCLDAPAQMPSGSMVSPSLDRIDQGRVGRGDDDAVRHALILKLLALREKTVA